MSETKHTPGPWRWCDTSVYGDPLSGPNLDCLIGPDKDPEREPYPSDSADHIIYLDAPITPENLANARLIAAAPELLEALEHMVAVSNWATTIQSEEQYDAMIANAGAAIRKAKGE